MKISSKLTCRLPHGTSFFQHLAAFTGTLTMVTCGMHDGWPSPSLPILGNLKNSTLSINDDQGSWIAVMPLIGGLFGVPFAASIIDLLGRKPTIIFTNIPFLIAWIMIAFTESINVIYIARFIAGLADGIAFTAVPIYIGEISDPKIRGLLGSGAATYWIFGMLLINIIGSYLSISATALVSLSLPILTFVTFIWMPESPYYLVMKGLKVKADKSLQILRGKKDVNEELTRISQAVKAQMQDTGKFLDLFTRKSNRKAVYIVAILRGFQQLSGVTTINFYSQIIFKEAGSDISSKLISTIYFSVQLLFMILTASVIDKTGRKLMIVISLVGSALALFLEGTYFFLKTQTSIDVTSYSYLSVIFLFAFIIFFSSGMQCIPVVLLGEVFPANVKAFAFFLADVYYYLVVAIVSKLFQIVKDSFGIYVPFYFFTGSCLVGLVLTVLFVPETKGKSLEDIQVALGGKVGGEDGEEKNSRA